MTADDRRRRIRPRYPPAWPADRSSGPHRPRAGAAGPQGPRLPGYCKEALERRPTGHGGPHRLAQRLRRKEQAAAQERRAHRRRAWLRRGAGKAVALPRLGDSPARPSEKSIKILPLWRQDALHPPRRLRRPQQRPDHLALLPGVGAPRRAAHHYGRPPCALSALLLLPPSHRARPAVLVVFDDDLAATHFLRVAREEMDRTGVRVPLWVSHRTALAKAGPLGRAWRTPEGSEHVRVLPGR